MEGHIYKFTNLAIPEVSCHYFFLKGNVIWNFSDIISDSWSLFSSGLFMGLHILVQDPWIYDVWQKPWVFLLFSSPFFISLTSYITKTECPEWPSFHFPYFDCAFVFFFLSHWYREQNTVFLRYQPSAGHRRLSHLPCNRYYVYIVVAYQCTHLLQYVNLHRFISAWRRTLINENYKIDAEKLSFSLLEVRYLGTLQSENGQKASLLKHSFQTACHEA